MIVQVPVHVDAQGQSGKLGGRRIQIQSEIETDGQGGIEPPERAQVPVPEAPDDDIQLWVRA